MSAVPLAPPRQKKPLVPVAPPVEGYRPRRSDRTASRRKRSFLAQNKPAVIAGLFTVCFAALLAVSFVGLSDSSANQKAVADVSGEQLYRNSPAMVAPVDQKRETRSVFGSLFRTKEMTWKNCRPIVEKFLVEKNVRNIVFHKAGKPRTFEFDSHIFAVGLKPGDKVTTVAIEYEGDLGSRNYSGEFGWHTSNRHMDEVRIFFIKDGGVVYADPQWPWFEVAR